jgi:hypothetical protein
MERVAVTDFVAATFCYHRTKNGVENVDVAQFVRKDKNTEKTSCVFVQILILC